jgi:hypothetical protein
MYQQQQSLSTSSSVIGTELSSVRSGEVSPSLVDTESEYATNVSSSMSSGEIVSAAVEKYRDQVRATHARAEQCTLQRKASATTTTTTTPANNNRMSLAYDCLQKTTPNLHLEYPEDAEEHYNAIRLAMAPWAQTSAHLPHTGINYNGPWIENYWISNFEPLFDDPPITTDDDDKNDDNNDNTTACLSTYFGPFIPIFVPFVDHFCAMGFDNRIYPPGLMDTLLSQLRPNVPYIAVSQNDLGLYLNQLKLPNLLVLSAGGYGHIPIPLLKQFEPLNNDVDLKERPYDLSYVGRLDHAPKNMRKHVHSFFNQYSQATFNSVTQENDFKYLYYHGDDWKQVMRNSRFS